MNGVRSRRREEGFVLYETLIALMLSLVMLGLFSAALGTARRISVLQEDAGDVTRAAAAANALLIWFDGALKFPVKPDTDGAELFFRGKPESVRFAMLGMAEAQTGGANAIEVSRERGQFAPALFFRSWPLDPDSMEAGRKAADRELLVGDLDDARFAYFGAKATKAAPTWHNEWSAQTSLPTNISLSILMRGAGPSRRFDWNFRVRVQESTSAGRPEKPVLRR